MSYTVRQLGENESSVMRALANACPPLDLHTPYTYWVISKFFSDWCFVLEYDKVTVGFLMALCRDNTVFLWQIGILTEHRGQGCSGLLYQALMDRVESTDRDTVLVTIADGNQSSRSSLESFCRKTELVMERLESVEVTDLVDADFSEIETLYRITKA